MYSIHPEHHLGLRIQQWCVSSSRVVKNRKAFQYSSRGFHYYRRLSKTTYPATPSLEQSHLHRHILGEKLLIKETGPSVLSTSDAINYDSISKSQDSNQFCQAEPLSHNSHVAILGGGISGLATAHFLLREIPSIKVTLYECKNRLGGWLQSESVEIGNGKVLLESGPRTLRYGTTSSLVTAEIIQDLGLEDKVITTAKDSIAAKNRYVYYPDHLVRMPASGESLVGNIIRILSEPVFTGILPAFLEFTRSPRAPDLEDESVASFFSRRLGGDSLVNNIHSAVLHGIYAGDVNQLSVRSLFPTLWYMEKHFGSLLKGVFICAKNRIQLISPSDFSIRKEVYPKIRSKIDNKLKSAGVFSFEHGLESLSRALEERICAVPNVKLKLGHEVKSIQLASDGIEIQTSENNSSSKYSHIVSTLLPHQTSSLTSLLPSLALIPSVTVMVVNLYFDSTEILFVRGFGYLIPRTVPYEQNPECALGVVFDSDAMPGQDTIPGTKLTVMLGGHWWDGLMAYPDEEEGANMAKAVLRRHLGIIKEPSLVRVNLQKECIPQYTVGHEGVLARVKEEMGNLNGRLSVTGCGYKGVGVNDCIATARDLVTRMTSCTQHKTVTGLEWLDEDLQQMQINDTSS